MSKHFHSFQELGIHLATHAIHEYKHNMEHALHEVGEAVVHRVKEKIGEYQPSIGPYPKWEDLKQETLERKQRSDWGKGGNPNTPLYATGEFEKDIEFTVDKADLKVSIGTHKDYIVATELGDPSHNLPARPVFAPAALETTPKFLHHLQQSAVDGLATKGATGFAIIDADPSNPNAIVVD